MDQGQTGGGCCCGTGREVRGREENGSWNGARCGCGSSSLHPHPHLPIRLRAFYANNYSRGLIFTCADGCVDLSAPVAVLAAIAARLDAVSHGTPTLPCPVYPDRVIVGHKLVPLDDVAPSDIARLTREARIAWMQGGHPR